MNNYAHELAVAVHDPLDNVRNPKYAEHLRLAFPIPIGTLLQMTCSEDRKNLVAIGADAHSRIFVTWVSDWPEQKPGFYYLSAGQYAPAQPHKPSRWTLFKSWLCVWRHRIFRAYQILRGEDE